jgi:hypothetical protein
MVSAISYSLLEGQLSRERIWPSVLRLCRMYHGHSVSEEFTDNKNIVISRCALGSCHACLPLIPALLPHAQTLTMARFRVYTLKRSRNYNSICKLWWHQYNNTNEFFFFFSVRKNSFVADTENAHHLLEDKQPPIGVLSYKVFPCQDPTNC